VSRAARDPIARIERWLRAARRAGERLPEAMALATSAADGEPSARFVLLEAIDRRGFAFSCSAESRKARELAARPRAALALYWHRPARQVRIEGRVEAVASADVDRWWRRYTRDARLSTRAAARLSRIDSRSELVRAYRDERRRFPRGAVPRPASWQSYRVVPEAIELWEARPHRLHYRERFERGRQGRWTARLLVP